MASSDTDVDSIGPDGFFPAPHSLAPLPDGLRWGLIAPGITGVLSAVSTFALIIFILQRFISWRQHYKTFIGYNQYVMLVLMLLIADFQQAAAFLISWRWIAMNRIVAPTPACFAQGWLLHSGDVSSGLFVLAIAVHTFLTAVPGWRISNWVFYLTVAFIWIFSYVLTFVGVIMHQEKYFVRAGAWCWVSSDYEGARLGFHYIWVFIVEFATIFLYAVTFFALRSKTKKLFNNTREERDRPNPKTVKAVHRITRLMMLYPCVYILLTLPLSVGRMWTMAHQGQSMTDAFACVAGALLGSCGWVDALLYTLTRKRLLSETMPGRSDRSTSMSAGITATRTITVHDSAAPPGSGPAMREFMRVHRMSAPGQDDSAAFNLHEKNDSVAVSEHVFDRPVSKSGSIDPIWRRPDSTIGYKAEIQYGVGELLDEEHEPEYLEMGELGNGRKGPVPRGSGRAL